MDYKDEYEHIEELMVQFLEGLVPRIRTQIRRKRSEGIFFKLIEIFESNSPEDKAIKAKIIVELIYSNIWQAIFQFKHFQMLKLIDANDLKAVINEGHVHQLFNGTPLAFFLAKTSPGLLRADSFRLAKLIDFATLNYTIRDGEFKGHSLAYWLAMKCPEVFAADGFRLAKLIAQSTWDAIIPQGDHQGETVALYLSMKEQGADIVSRNRSKISKDVLNAFPPIGAEYEGYGLAFSLVRSFFGLKLLKANNFRMARMITKKTLNANVNGDEINGVSAAYHLARNTEGLEILADDDFRLAKLIEKKWLNHVVMDQPVPGDSMLFWLARHKLGRDILKAKDFRLLNWVDETALNAIQTVGGCKGYSAAWSFAAYDIEILIKDDFRLARLINKDALNEMPSLGSVAFLLAISAPEIFELDTFRLAGFIDIKTLNAIIPDGKYKGSSLAWWLLDQPEILRANGSRLEKLIDKDRLNEVKKQFGESPAALRAQLQQSRQKPRGSSRP